MLHLIADCAGLVLIITLLIGRKVRDRRIEALESELITAQYGDGTGEQMTLPEPVRQRGLGAWWI